jgi:hypothetical protein
MVAEVEAQILRTRHGASLLRKLATPARSFGGALMTGRSVAERIGRPGNLLGSDLSQIFVCNHQQDVIQSRL